MTVSKPLHRFAIAIKARTTTHRRLCSSRRRESTFSATVIASAMQDSKAGDGLPSQFTSLRAARMAAAMSRTRFRPSSTAGRCSIFAFCSPKDLERSSGAAILASMRSPRRVRRNESSLRETVSIPAAEALSFLKQTKGNVTWGIGDLAKTLNIPIPEAKRIASVLELQGYVKPQGSEWMTTAAGEEVSGAKPPRFTREAVEQALDQVRGRIQDVNRDPKSPFRVTEAVAFGDFLFGQPRVQAADVGIQLARRQANDNSPFRERAAQRAFLKQLRGRSAMLHLLPYESWMSHRSHSKLL